MRRTLSLAAQLLANRRQFLLSGASLAVLPWLGNMATGAVRRRASFPIAPFQLGVASGDPHATGVVLWTRLAPKPLEGGGMDDATYEVRWELADDDAMKNIVRQGVAHATPQLAHSVHVELDGLEPDRWYWYRFTAGDAVSPIGRTRTMPVADAMPDQLRFAFTSCQYFEHGYYTGYEHIAQEPLDLIFHLGDYIYEYAAKENQVRKHVGQETVSLDDYRNRHAQYKTDAHLQAAHRLCPWGVVWDDHEVDNNYANNISEQHGVSPEDMLLRRANAYQAYYEHMPLHSRSIPQGPNMRIYRTIPFGKLAEFSLLDTRQYRSDQPNGDGLKPLKGGALDSNATMLGKDQEAWLQESLLASPAAWNVLAQQVMMGLVDRRPGEALYSMDQWPGYEIPRRRLLSFLAEREIKNPVVLTGDIHSNWVNNLQLDATAADSPAVATEFVCTSIASGGNGAAKPGGLEKLLAANPFVKFHNAERGYTSCTVTPKEWRSDYKVVEYIDRPGAPLVNRASFVIEAGQAGAKET